MGWYLIGIEQDTTGAGVALTHIKIQAVIGWRNAGIGLRDAIRATPTRWNEPGPTSRRSS